MINESYKECASLIDAAKQLCKANNIVVSDTGLYKLFEIYSAEKDKDHVLDYLETLTAGKFSLLKDNIASDEHEIFLVLKQGYWSTIHSAGLKGDNDKIYKFTPDNVLDKFTFSSLIHFWLSKKSGFFSLFIISLVISLLALGIPLYMNAIYGRIIPASAEASLWTLSCLLLSFFLFEMYFKKTRAGIMSGFIHDFSFFFEPKILRSLLAIISSEENKWGKSREEAVRNLSRLRSLLWMLASSSIFDLFFMVIYLGAIAIVGKWLVCAVLIMILVQLAAVFLLDKKSSNDANKYSITDDRLPIPFIDSYKGNGIDKEFNSIYFAKCEHSNISEKIKLENKVSSGATIGFITSLQTVVIVITAYYLLQAGAISSGALFATIILSGKINQSISGISSLIPLCRQLKSCIKNINSVISPSSAVLPIHCNDNFPWKGWKVNDLSFSYDKNSGINIFENISFNIRQGEKVAIVGANGAGKTTLSHLILGLKKASGGRISYQGDGKDFEKNSIYYFPQKNFLYHDNLYDYLGLNSDKEEHLKTLFSRSLFKWIPSFFSSGLHASLEYLSEPLGLDKLQTLEMARLALSDKNIFVLDEPTAYVNAEVERQFSKLLSDKMDRNSTLILFTGRKNLLELVDRIIFIDSGKVAFNGPAGEFMLLTS